MALKTKKSRPKFGSGRGSKGPTSFRAHPLKTKPPKKAPKKARKKAREKAAVVMVVPVGPSFMPGSAASIGRSLVVPQRSIFDAPLPGSSSSIGRTLAPRRPKKTKTKTQKVKTKTKTTRKTAHKTKTARKKSREAAGGVVTLQGILRNAKSSRSKKAAWLCVGRVRTGCGGGKRGGHVAGILR